MKKIFISGFGYSGSGMVIDILRNFNGVYVFEPEFRLLVDSYGILSLRCIFRDEVNHFNKNVAINNFYRLCTVLSRKNRLSLGFNYNSLMENRFLEVTDNYINKIFTGKYWSNAFVFQYSKTDISQVLWKIFKKTKLINKNDFHGIPVSEEEFIIHTKNYLDEIFSLMCPNGKDTLIIDNGISPYGLEMADDIIEDALFCIVGRDPRDVYLDLKECSDVDYPVEEFITLYKTQYSLFFEKYVNKSNVYYIQFEKFIENYNEELKNLLKYIGLYDDYDGNCINIYDISKSKTNIKKYDALSKDDVQKIESELMEYCIT